MSSLSEGRGGGVVKEVVNREKKDGGVEENEKGWQTHSEGVPFVESGEDDRLSTR
jgi:hypothetical protein